MATGHNGVTRTCETIMSCKEGVRPPRVSLTRR